MMGTFSGPLDKWWAMSDQSQLHILGLLFSLMDSFSFFPSWGLRFQWGWGVSQVLRLRWVIIIVNCTAWDLRFHCCSSAGILVMHDRFISKDAKSLSCSGWVMFKNDPSLSKFNSVSYMGRFHFSVCPVDSYMGSFYFSVCPVESCKWSSSSSLIGSFAVPLFQWELIKRKGEGLSCQKRSLRKLNLCDTGTMDPVPLDHD